MNSEGNPQSKRKHQRATENDRPPITAVDKQDLPGNTPRRSPDATRPTQHSPSKLESQQHSRGARKSGKDE